MQTLPSAGRSFFKNVPAKNFAAPIVVARRRPDVEEGEVIDAMGDALTSPDTIKTVR